MNFFPPCSSPYVSRVTPSSVTLDPPRLPNYQCKYLLRGQHECWSGEVTIPVKGRTVETLSSHRNLLLFLPFLSAERHVEILGLHVGLPSRLKREFMTLATHPLLLERLCHLPKFNYYSSRSAQPQHLRFIIYVVFFRLKDTSIQVRSFRVIYQ